MRVDGRWVAAALAASLFLNLFLAGVAAGRWLTPPPRAPAGFAPGARVRLLPADERARFVGAMRPHRPGIRAARQAVREARTRVEADVAGPAYDRPRVEADLAALRQANLAHQAAVHGALAEALEQVSPASRAALVAPVHTPRALPSVGNGEAAR